MNDTEPQTAAGKVLWHLVLTHHPEDATPADGVTFLDCDPTEAVRIGLESAGGKNLECSRPRSAVSSCRR